MGLFLIHETSMVMMKRLMGIHLFLVMLLLHTILIQWTWMMMLHIILTQWTWMTMLYTSLIQWTWIIMIQLLEHVTVKSKSRQNYLARENEPLQTQEAFRERHDTIAKRK